MPELQQTINAFNSAFPTRSAIETRAALTATLGQARALRKDARSTNAHLVSKFCQDTAEAMKVLERLITDNLIPWCDEQIAENGGTAPNSGDLAWYWDSIGLQEDPVTGYRIFTPLYLAPDYYANACDVYLASAQEARDEFLDDLVESAKNVGETVTSGVKIAFPALALAVFAFLVLKD